MAVLHRDAMRRVDAQAAGGKQIGFGIGLWPFHIAARHDDIEIMDQAAAFQPLLREGRGGGRGERHRDAGARQMIEQQVRAGTKRNAGILRRLEQRVTVGIKLREWEVRAKPLCQNPLIFIAMDADHRQQQFLPKRPAQRMAGIDKGPAMRGFRIDQRAVHIEDNGPDRIREGRRRRGRGQDVRSHV